MNIKITYTLHTEFDLNRSSRLTVFSIYILKIFGVRRFTTLYQSDDSLQFETLHHNNVE